MTRWLLAHASSSQYEPKKNNARRQRFPINSLRREPKKYNARQWRFQISSSEKEPEKYTARRRRLHASPSENESKDYTQRPPGNRNKSSEWNNSNLGDGESGDVKQQSDSDIESLFPKHRMSLGNLNLWANTFCLWNGRSWQNRLDTDYCRDGWDIRTANIRDTDYGEGTTGAFHDGTVEPEERNSEGEDVLDFMANISAPERFDVVALIDAQQEQLVGRRRILDSGDNLFSKSRLHKAKSPGKYAETDEECATKSIREIEVQYLRR